MKTKGKSWTQVFNDILKEMAENKGFSLQAFKNSNQDLIKSFEGSEITPFEHVCDFMGIEPDVAISLFKRDIERLIPVIQ